MPDLSSALRERLQPAFDAVEPGADPVVRQSDRGDYQANGVMAIAKRLGRPPRELAAAIEATADLDGIATIEVAGPGFLNLRVEDGYLARSVEALRGDARRGVATAPLRHRVALDYSHPNVAKEMHVGHLRSTVIGDALARILRFYGHEVIARNHIGDWGTPFGMLIEHLRDVGEDAAAEELSVGDLDGFYRAARQKFDADPAFAERSRRRVVALQAGDEETRRLWGILVAESVRYFERVYRTLEVSLRPEDVVPESFYNPLLDQVVADLDAGGLLVEDDGALCVFPEGFSNREGEPLPVIVRKRDGGYGYAATDLAAIRDRVGTLGCDRLYYVVGAPQSQHLEMVFAVARAAGWLPDAVEAVHVAFGSVLGTDHKMLKSRAGGTLRLIDLLDEAVARADRALVARDAEYRPDERALLAEAIGIGAVKYADLSTERLRDYVFDWDRMLSFDGNTGPYLAYAHARIKSIFRRVGVDAPAPDATVVLAEGEERTLALELLRLPEALDATLEWLAPHRLCAYLFGLSQTFTAFYERCPVLRAPDDATRQSRLVLCDETARTLALGLSLLGIDAPDRM
ncbi:MAG TPA: arginine--tRNA ligase [Acidimicrobiales bacterium]|nr:arginine--tRNA ligase [Acidimicrobiales bacterium]